MDKSQLFLLSLISLAVVIGWVRHVAKKRQR